MQSIKLAFRHTLRIAVRSSLLAALLVGSAGVEPVYADSGRGQAVPAGYEKFLLYVGDGVYDSSVPNPNPAITGCVATGMCDGDYFQREIMGRDTAEIEMLEAEAKMHFSERFGLDVDDPANAGRLMLRRFMLDPRLNYHLISASQDRVPSEGRRVRDGGWTAVVVDPEGFDLGGLFAGRHVPYGTMVVFGDYNIQPARSERHWQRREPLVIRYLSTDPQLPTDRSFQCEIQHPEFGTGLVRGRQEMLPVEGNRVRLHAVSFLSFPGFSTLFD